MDWGYKEIEINGLECLKDHQWLGRLSRADRELIDDGSVFEKRFRLQWNHLERVALVRLREECGLIDTHIQFLGSIGALQGTAVGALFRVSSLVNRLLNIAAVVLGMMLFVLGSLFLMSAVPTWHSLLQFVFMMSAMLLAIGFVFQSFRPWVIFHRCEKYRKSYVVDLCNMPIERAENFATHRSESEITTSSPLPVVDARQNAKRGLVLRFLREELWSTASVLGEVIGIRARQAVHRSLQQLENAGLLRRHTYTIFGHPLTIWGITAHGQACAFDPATEEPVSAYFEPSRVSGLTIAHAVALQKLRVAAERAGWKDWKNGDRLGAVRDGKRPDAIAVSPEGIRTAIECERTMKTTKRYEVILAHYLQSLRRGQLARVVWLCPDADKCCSTLCS